MALLVSSVFGATGCGSDDDVAVESRVKNAAPEASGASDAPSKADCDRLNELDVLDLRYFRDVLDLRYLRQLDARISQDKLLSPLDPLLDFPKVRDFSRLSFLRDVLDDLNGRGNLDDLDDLRDLRGLLGLLDDLDDLRYQCDAVSKSGADAPEDDDVDRG
jgi:hypothetical protein